MEDGLNNRCQKDEESASPVTHTLSMAPRGRKTSTSQVSDLEISASTLHTLNRATLQQLCKKLKLKANGKNTELLERLQAHYQSNRHSSAPTAENSQSPAEKRTLLQKTLLQTKSRTETCGHGWCLIHGMELRLPPTSWVPLVLRGGRACVPHGEQASPLLLVPASTVVPPHLDDNYICQECALRNREKEAWNDQRGNLQVPAVKMSPDFSLPQNTSFNSTKRTRHKSGKYHPQENPDYARRVDEMLSKMAVGELDYSNVLCPSKPTVVHSPIAKTIAAQWALAIHH
ncbi:developmental pluripotency-associated protein 2-like isoform X1 [Pleurodeles waltl]|uniref:developmental pluripotency-associated protein 2-like isoform X1 n=2 Tax=Pleurodeles waltl TaxID=8319 RepID=UPI003709490B